MANIIAEMDMVFLSYDEPNCDENWVELSDVAPWATRVHGVTGFDAAHRACGFQSTTPYTVTVDGDTTIDPTLLDIEIPNGLNKVLSWTSTNVINGLTYGNGGIKLWPTEVLRTMASHELSNQNNAVDFCWNDNYVQLWNCYSVTRPNGSALQAFRAGFREGVKMVLDRGVPMTSTAWTNTICRPNYRRILSWMSIGDDVANGIYAIYGSRLGLLHTLTKQSDIGLIADYTRFNDFCESMLQTDVYVAVDAIEQQLGKLGVSTPLLSKTTSVMVKELTKHQNTTNPLATERDIRELFYE